jgi:hypothetical protein
MRCIRQDGVFRDDPLSAVQVGSQNDSGSQRGRRHLEANSPGRDSLNFRVSSRRLVPDVFIPKIGVIADEIAHHLNAIWILQNLELYATLPEQILRSHEILMFANDNLGNFIEQSSTRTHDARAECAYECELAPVAPSSGVPDTDGFSVRRWITRLNSQVVAACHDEAILVSQHRAYR